MTPPEVVSGPPTHGVRGGVGVSREVTTTDVVEDGLAREIVVSPFESFVDREGVVTGPGTGPGGEGRRQHRVERTEVTRSRDTVRDPCIVTQSTPGTGGLRGSDHLCVCNSILYILSRSLTSWIDLSLVVPDEEPPPLHL